MLKPATKLGPFPSGIDNRVDAHEIPPGCVRDAVNVDITARGKLRRRQGVTQSVAGASVRSLWSTRAGRGFYADADTLYEFTPGVRRQVASVTSHADIAFLEVPGRGIAFSDGITLRRIVDDQVLPFAIRRPQASPSVFRAAGGSIPAGLFAFGVSWVDQFGEESGVGQTVQVECADGDAITVAFPVGAPPEVVSVNLYMTPHNSESLGLYGNFPVGLMGTTISVLSDLGREPSTRFTLPLPACDMLAFLNGRTYGARGALLSWTEPWSGQHNPLKNVISFPAPITILYATPTGMWIVADQTYFLSGDPNQQGSLRARSPHTGVRGTLVEAPDTKTAMWFSDQGLVVTGEDGAISFVQQNHIQVLPAAEGATLYREQNGEKQVVVNTKGAGLSVAAAGTWFAATISSGEVRDGFA